MANSVMRFPRVREVTGLSRSTIWRLEHAGKFPHRIKLSTNIVGWRQDEVDAWLRGRIPVEAGEIASQPKHHKKGAGSDE